MDRLTALRLADYNPSLSQVERLRIRPRTAACHPVLARELSAPEVDNYSEPACGAAQWRRVPMRITFD